MLAPLARHTRPVDCGVFLYDGYDMYNTILILVLDRIVDVVLEVVPLDANMNALLLDVFSNTAAVLVDCCIFLDAVPHPVAYQNGGTFAAIVPDDEGYDRGHCRCWEGLGVAAYEKRGKEIYQRWRNFVKIRR